MSFKVLLSKELKINPEISFEEASERFPGLTRTNFDLIRYEYRRDVLGIKTKIISKIKKKSKKNIESGVKSNFHEQKKIKKIRKLTPDTTEKLILDMLNKESSIPESQIRIAVDFMVKVKRNEVEDDFMIDAKYLKLAESEEGIEHQLGDIVKAELNMDEFQKAEMDIKEHGSKPTLEEKLVEGKELTEQEKAYSNRFEQ